MGLLQSIRDGKYDSKLDLIYSAIQKRKERIQFRVKVWDAGRDSFITQWFNGILPAEDFMDRVIAENESHFRE